MTTNTFEITSIITTSNLLEGLDSLNCLYEELGSTYEQGRWSGNDSTFVIDDTAKEVTPW